MRLLSWLLCAAAAIVPAFTSEERSVSRPKRDSSEKKIVCYYTNWSVYRPGTAKFTPQNINPYLCTHLIYAFGGLSKDNALKPFDKYQDIEQGGYAKFNGLKTYNKNLKTMLAIGGWNEGSARFSPLVADAERRKELVKNTVKFLRQNHFDGLDLDWEYPSFRDGGKPRDRDNYATLVQEFREEFERESEKTGRPRLLLTMAVPAGIEYIDKGYDVPKLNKYLDWMNILSYDYHSAFEPTINHHSPLFSLEDDDEYNFDAALNIDHTIQHYLKLGADKSKLVLGIPTYGRSYSLFNPDATDIGSPADGPGEQGEATREKGYLAYYEICERVSSGGWTLENPNPEAMGPYAYKGNQWVGFDDEDIVKIKAKYVNDNDLGGIMFWSIDNDDFRGKCHGKPYPLIEAAKEALLANANELVPSSRSGAGRSSLKKQEQETSLKTKTRKTRLRTKSSTTTESSQTKSSGRTSTTPQPPTTPDPGSDFMCKDEGFFPHPRDCKKYFWCLDSGPSSLGIVAHQFTCPSGLVFNKISDSCDYARNVICKTKSESASTTTTTTTTTTTARTTTARSRLVITASSPRTTTTTTTTTEAPQEEELEEVEEEEEEDPGTIKELINLIKKLGGVEQLEKQLNLQNSDEKEKIKPSLYSRVLQGRTANRYRGVTGETTTQKYLPVFRNRPVGPQSPALEESSTTRGSEKPRYVTIQRNRSTKKPSKVEEEVEEEEEEEEVEERPKPVQETPRSFRRRPNPDTTTEREYVVLRRSRPQKEEDTSTQKYKNIVRVRSTTEATLEKEEEEEEEEEEEVEEVEKEEEETETEPAQKLKKYSSIIRDNKKIVAEEEEPKVSGRQGSRYENEVSSTTTDYVSNAKENVNNVNTVTSPRYIEIRRTQPTSTETTGNNVYNVNNSHDSNQENVDETNEVYESQHEDGDNKIGGFQRRSTTEIVKRPTRLSFRSSTLASTTPITIDTTNNDIKIPRFRERQQSAFTTDASSTISIKPIGLFRGLHKNAPETQVIQNEATRLPIQEKPFRSTSTTAVNPSVNDPPRRFQFAPRTKPAILSSKNPESTTEVFQITVPDIPSPDLTENSLTLASFPSVTLEATTSPTVDSTTLDVLEDGIALTNLGELNLSTNQFIPTTSTQTSVVTSITESSFTERKRIFVPKKDRKAVSDLKLDTDTFTTERTLETTKPYYRAQLNRINRVTTPKIEVTTESRKRRFKTKTTSTTTTEQPAPAKKYVAKKTRTFKRITSTEPPEVTSSSTERPRFTPRNRPRHVEGGPSESSNSLQARFNTAKRKKIFSKKEEDDLEVEQTATFFEDDFDNDNKYILGGAVKQTSDKDYLNADVLFRIVPTVEEEEKAEKGENELINPLKSNRTTVRHAGDKTAETNKESIRNKFIVTNPALRNLRTRTRQTTEGTPLTESTNTKNVPQSQSNRGIQKNNFLTSGSNLRTFKGRNEQNNGNNVIEKEVDETRSTQSFRQRKVKPNAVRGKLLGTNDNLDHVTPEDADGIFGTKTASTPATSFSTRNPNYRNLKSRTRQEVVTEKTSESDITYEEEGPKNEVLRRFKAVRKPTESPNAITEGPDNQSFKNGRTRNGIFKETLIEKQTEATPSELPTKSTKSSATYSTGFSSQTAIKEGRMREGTIVTPSLTSTSVRGQSLGNLITTKTSHPVSTKEPLIDEETFATDPTVGSTFGVRIVPTVPSTTASTVSTTFSVNIGSTATSATGSIVGARVGSTVPHFIGSTVGTRFVSSVDSSTGSAADSTFGTKVGFTVASTSPSTETPTIRGTFITLAPKPIIQKAIEADRISDSVTESSQASLKSKEPIINKTLSANVNQSNFRSFRTRTRSTTVSPGVLEKTDKSSEKNNSSFDSNRVLRTRGRVKAIDSIFQATENGAINETDTEFRIGRTVVLKEGRRRVLVRRPIQSTPGVKEEENELEPPEEQPSGRSKTASDKRVTQEYLSNFRSRGKTTTQATVTTERLERKRTQLDRRRFRGETRSTTTKPDVQSEAPSSTSRASILLRRKLKPSTTTTTTTTEEPYIEQQEDSRLEESKALDETPGIQDLADPAVVAIHNLATVSPGPIVSGATASLNTFPQTPATYTVHVTPSDIASFSTTGNIAAVTPGAISSRPTSILTLKPYTVPLITRQYITKQTPAPFRSAAPVRETAIPLITKEPYSPRGEILLQSRKQETTQRAKPSPFVSAKPEKDLAPKSRRLKPFSKVPKQEVAQSATSSEPPVDYEYYDDDEDPLANIPASALKVKVHSDGYIECLDRGNFPHPFSCKKFISCAKMENNELLGWEYTCPKHLSFDPVGGICNWSAGLGCQH